MNILGDARTLVLFLFTFTLIVAVHEFGHYFTARLLGMKVLEYAIGFGPKLFGWRKSEIDYSVRAIPFGGYVRILGQDDFSIHQEGEGDPEAFTTKPWWAQAIVLVAGVTMNVVLALLMLTIAFASGTTAATGDVRVDQVATGSPAEKAGIQVGDVVRSIDGRGMTRSAELVTYVRQKAQKETEMTLEIERNGRPIPAIRAVPRAEPPEGEGPLGIRLEDVQGPVSVAVPEAFGQAVQLAGDVVQQIGQLPGQIIAARGGGTGGPQVGGPIQIFVVTGQVAEFGIPTFLKLIGVLSVNLAVLNIVPFPGLDGGRLFFVLVAGIFRRRLSPTVEAAIHAVGFVLLLLLLVVVSISDIRRVVGG
ncbi:MAG TPA: M50 family metallopeptidase [Candidatus Limnocylindrales bacterium]|nr:M50 family metallopeptidase [Candidatus Limnocylindrales bacterium]